MTAGASAVPAERVALEPFQEWRKWRRINGTQTSTWQVPVCPGCSYAAKFLCGPCLVWWCDRCYGGHALEHRRTAFEMKRAELLKGHTPR